MAFGKTFETRLSSKRGPDSYEARSIRRQRAKNGIRLDPQAWKLLG